MIVASLAVVTGCRDSATQARTVNVLFPSPISVGQTFLLMGEDFSDPGDGCTMLHFQGQFVEPDGTVHQAMYTTVAAYDGILTEPHQASDVTVPAGAALFRLSRFGPFQVPFVDGGDAVGTFTGTVTVESTLPDGQVSQSVELSDVELTVEPSIIIRRFEPFVGLSEDGEPLYAACGAPALRGIGGLPYMLEVEAVGFEPEFFTYELHGFNGVSEGVVYTHEAEGRADGVGAPETGELLLLDQVMELDSFYWAIIRISASVKGSSGEFVETVLPMSVHRPLGVGVDDGGWHVAQHYEPVLVSGCVSSTSAAPPFHYTEAQSESRQNAVSITIGLTEQSAKVLDLDPNSWLPGITLADSVVCSGCTGPVCAEGANAPGLYGLSYTLADAHVPWLSTTDGQDWSFTWNEGTTKQEFQDRLAEVHGMSAESPAPLIDGALSIPLLAKTSGKVSTSLSAIVGSKRQKAWEMEGGCRHCGASSESNSVEGLVFGGVTFDSWTDSLQSSYVLTPPVKVGAALAEHEVSDDSVVYDFGGGNVKHVVTVGDEDAWTQTWTATSEYTVNAGTGLFPAGKSAAWYRQTSRVIKKARIYSYNLCGVRELAGEMTFQEWQWNAAMKLMDSCSEDDLSPPDTLPPPECIIPPCN